MRKRLMMIIVFIGLPFFAAAQDCCGPGGGGSRGAPAISAVTGVGDYIYRLKSVRRYAYCA